MQKIFIDSSTWVSFLARDRNIEPAEKIFHQLFRKKDQRKIIVPRLVYLEVINSMYKLNVTMERVETFKNFFKNRKKIQLVKTREKIYIKAEVYAPKVWLKTLDLLILTEALENKVDKFISFDKKLRKAYYQLTHDL